MNFWSDQQGPAEHLIQLTRALQVRKSQEELVQVRWVRVSQPVRQYAGPVHRLLPPTLLLCTNCQYCYDAATATQCCAA